MNFAFLLFCSCLGLVSLARVDLSIWDQLAFGVFGSASSWMDGMKLGTNDAAVFGANRTTLNATIRTLFLLPQTLGCAWIAAGNYEFAFASPEAEVELETRVVGGGGNELITEWITVPDDLTTNAILTMTVPPFNDPGTVHTHLATSG